MFKPEPTLTPQDFADNESFRRWVYNQPPDDAQYWTDYLNQHPEQREQADLGRLLLLTVRGDLPTLTDAQAETAIRQILMRAEGTPVRALPGRNPWRTAFVRAAALAALVLLAGILGQRWYAANRPALAVNGSKPAPKTVPDWIVSVNRQTMPRLVRLADGSLVVLQPKARLRYPRRFASSNRDVQLTGTAFFEVVKNPAKPFRVFAGALTTEVLGTSFSINAPASGEHVRVVVKTGRVRVSTNPGTVSDNHTNRNPLRSPPAVETVLLLPNQQVAFSPTTTHLVRSRVTIPLPPGQKLVAPALVFRRTPLPAVLETLEKAYGIPIQFDQDALASCTLTARLEDGTLFDKLAIITASTGSSYTLLNGQLVVHSAGCR